MTDSSRFHRGKSLKEQIQDMKAQAKFGKGYKSLTAEQREEIDREMKRSAKFAK